ncbi:MAG TPA: PKD domain-containing protein [Acidobacteriota bacterium]
MKKMTLVFISCLGLVILPAYGQCLSQADQAEIDSKFQGDLGVFASLGSVFPPTIPLLTDRWTGAQRWARSCEPYVDKAKAINAAICMMTEVRDRPTTSARDKDALNNVINDGADMRFKLFQGANVPLGGGGVNVRPAAGCKCSIKVVINGTLESRTTLRTFHGGPPDDFEAFCDPADGTYTWDFQPTDRAGISSHTSTRLRGKWASFVSERTGTFQVTVHYTAPDGSQCEAVQLVKEQ